jgi:hypothetical protein
MSESLLDTRMNEEIDKLIAQLEEAKAQKGSYWFKTRTVSKVAEEAKNYADYWQYKLDDWASD